MVIKVVANYPPGGEKEVQEMLSKAVADVIKRMLTQEQKEQLINELEKRLNEKQIH